MDRAKTVAAGVIALLLLAAGACGGRSGATRVIRVGSKNFTEQVVLGEIVAQQLERRLGRPVERRLNLGGTLLAHQALLSADIDVYPEYTGTALSAVLKLSTDANDAAATFTRVREEYRQRFQVEWLEPLGIDNGFAMVIKTRGGSPLRTLSDAAASPETWQLGDGYEFEQRPDGLDALNRVYGLRWAGAPRSMDLGLLYRALEQGQVSIIAANATDGLLTRGDFTALADDRHAFPPYEVCLAVRRSSLSGIPGLQEALQELSGRFTNQSMQRLNYLADVEHRPIPEIAASFLGDGPAR
ncbi:MAG: glycine betaine ABC transporter substrate-binding protein [Vicinamibacterales bacterium]